MLLGSPGKPSVGSWVALWGLLGGLLGLLGGPLGAPGWPSGALGGLPGATSTSWLTQRAPFWAARSWGNPGGILAVPTRGPFWAALAVLIETVYLQPSSF